MNHIPIELSTRNSDWLKDIAKKTQMPELIIHPFGESKSCQKYVLAKFREGVYKLACGASGWIVHDALGNTAGQIAVAVRYV